MNPKEYQREPHFQMTKKGAQVGNTLHSDIIAHCAFRFQLRKVVLEEGVKVERWQGRDRIR